jgi:hypothetical protein
MNVIAECVTTVSKGVKFTDQELILVFSGKEIAGQKRWQVIFTPRTNAISQRDGDEMVYFSAPNRKDAEQMAIEYGMRIKQARVRWIAMAK